MKQYRVSVEGCDDTTCVLIYLTEEQYEVVKRLADLITATSTYSCEPKMYITECAANHH